MKTEPTKVEQWQQQLDAARLRAMQFQRQARMLAMLIPWSSSEFNFSRASGKAVCEFCGLEFFDHPHHSGNQLFVLCSGQFVKL